MPPPAKDKKKAKALPPVASPGAAVAAVPGSKKKAKSAPAGGMSPGKGAPMPGSKGGMSDEMELELKEKSGQFKFGGDVQPLSQTVGAVQNDIVKFGKVGQLKHVTPGLSAVDVAAAAKPLRASAPKPPEMGGHLPAYRQHAKSSAVPLYVSLRRARVDARSRGRACTHRWPRSISTADLMCRAGSVGAGPRAGPPTPPEHRLCTQNQLHFAVNSLLLLPARVLTPPQTPHSLYPRRHLPDEDAARMQQAAQGRRRGSLSAELKTNPGANLKHTSTVDKAEGRNALHSDIVASALGSPLKVLSLSLSLFLVPLPLCLPSD